MTRDVEVEIRGDEVIITKHADTEDARGTVAAIRRAVEAYNKNSDHFTGEAYQPDATEDEAAGDDETPEERRARIERHETHDR